MSALASVAAAVAAHVHLARPAAPVQVRDRAPARVAEQAPPARVRRVRVSVVPGGDGAVIYAALDLRVDLLSLRGVRREHRRGGASEKVFVQLTCRTFRQFVRHRRRRAGVPAQTRSAVAHAAALGANALDVVAREPAVAVAIKFSDAPVAVRQTALRCAA
eukprot:31492-Pelagococcus_subviridis.AAC.6